MQRVLVVDDGRVTADTLGLIFEKRGFDTQVVYSVDGALVSVLHHSIHVFVKSCPPGEILRQVASMLSV